MNINEAKEQVKNTVRAYLATNEVGEQRIPLSKQRPLFLVGAPGIGKTAIMAQVAQEMGIGLVSYSMTHHTRQSALGLPRIVHHDYKGLGYEASEYTMSEIVAEVYDFMTRTGLESGILFLDEINCVSETLYPSMLQFLQFKTFGQHRIPDNWVVVCAGNPPEYNRSVHEFDIVTLDRLRKIDVEPDLDAWHSYAADHGIHPAVLSFLETKNDRFYAVESTPEGKAFVTARGWEDLSETMKVYDDMDMPIDLQLVQQFIQMDDIAEDFALYYELFKKYRSDYQVDEILSGTVPDGIRQRAKEAAFDERLALLSLLLDKITGQCDEVLQKEAVVAQVRDVLKELKDPLLAGASIDDTLKKEATKRESALSVRIGAGTISASTSYVERMVIQKLKDLYQTCLLKGASGGSEAFDIIHYSYRGYVSDLERSVKTVQTSLDNAFDFLDDVFEDEREGLVFVTELTSRMATSKFISKFSSESYYRHNEGLMIDGHKEVLFTRIDELLGTDDGNEEVEVQTETDTETDITSDAKKEVEDKGAALSNAPTIASTSASTSVSASDTMSTPTSASTSTPTSASAPEPTRVSPVQKTTSDDDLNELETYYQGAPLEYGFTSLCKMTLPEHLGGKRILDIGSRRGKGVFKLSSRVGDSGYVLGIDWVPEYVEESLSRMERAWNDSGLSNNNMDFKLGYPEALDAIDLADDSFDVIFINNVFNLACNGERVLREFYRVLKPGGMVILETVIADNERDSSVLAEARRIGNSIQSSPSKSSLVKLLSDIGFREITYLNSHPVEPSDGALPDKPVPVVDSDEDIEFTACVMHVVK